MRTIAPLALIFLSLAFASNQSNSRSSRSAGTLLVSLSGQAQVALIDATTFKPITTLPVNDGPHEIAVSRDGRVAYVAIAGTGPGGTPGKSVAMIDLRAGTVRTFEEGMCPQPHDVRVSRDAALLWVACAPDQAVLELDARTGKLLKTWKTNVDGGWFVEVSRDERQLFVPHLEGKSLTIVDRKSGAAKNIGFGGGLAGIDLSPDGREVWVVANEKPDVTTVAIVNAGSAAVVHKFDLGGQGFGRFVFTPDGRQVVMALGKEMLVLDARARKIAARVALPETAKVITVSSDGSRAFLTSPGSNQVFVVDVPSGKLITSFPVGKQPDGIAWVN